MPLATLAAWQSGLTLLCQMLLNLRLIAEWVVLPAVGETLDFSIAWLVQLVGEQGMFQIE